MMQKKKKEEIGKLAFEYTQTESRDLWGSSPESNESLNQWKQNWKNEMTRIYTTRTSRISDLHILYNAIVIHFSSCQSLYQRRKKNKKKKKILHGKDLFLYNNNNININKKIGLLSMCFLFIFVYYINW